MLCSRDLADAGEADRLTRNLDASDQELSDYLYELAHSKGVDLSAANSMAMNSNEGEYTSGLTARQDCTAAVTK